MLAPVDDGDAWAITGGSFTTGGTYGISPVQVLHWDGRHWNVALQLAGDSSAGPAELAATSADDAYVIAQNASTRQPFIRHWDGTRWRNVPMRPAEHRPSPGSVEFRSLGLTVTRDGSIAALDAKGRADRLNFLWLRCPSSQA